MGDLLIVGLQLLMFAGPLFIFGVIIGRTVEKRHFRRIEERERETSDVLITQLKSFPMADRTDPSATVVMAEVVIGSDYLKSFFAKWRNIFGGEIKSFQTLQERAKREVILRLVDQTQDHGLNAICNVRINAADIGGNTMGGKNKIPMAAVIATGTAYRAAR